MSNKTLCIYHGNCADGFASAWVVRKALGEAAVDFHAGVYQDPPPDVSGRNVLLVDFSYKRPVLEKMAEKAQSITILDHHKTAEADLRDIGDSKIVAIFDINRSGARITWDFFFPDTPPPQLLLHIEDRDLWRFKLPATREIQAAVFSFPYDFTAWDDLMRPESIPMLIAGGQSIERKHFKDIKELLPIVTRRMIIGGHNVPIANLPYIHSSDAGHILAKGEAFAGCYSDTQQGRVFSLRSTDEGLDVSEIAKQYGGGGHRNAAGFRISYDKAAEFEIQVANDASY